MSRKPGKMYRSVKQQPYTRREYMGGVPVSRITQFDMGNKTTKFPFTVVLSADEKCQIRHNALESARISANKELEKHVGITNYHFRVIVYPHHVLRENKQATGAGADRVSQGMRASFGKAVGTAARVKAGQDLMFIEVAEKDLMFAKKALVKAGMKLPTSCTLTTTENT